MSLKADIKSALQSGSLPIPELLEVLNELQEIHRKAETNPGRNGEVNPERERAVAALLF